MQPINGLPGHRFCHALHTVVVGPVGMTGKVAFTFAKKISNQGLQLARDEPVFEIRRSETLPGSPGFEVVIRAIGLPTRVWVLRVDGLRQTLLKSDGRLRAIPYLRRIHKDVTKLHIHTKIRRRFLSGFVSDHTTLLKRFPAASKMTSRQNRDRAM